jgi:hypothetical protein
MRRVGKSGLWIVLTDYRHPPQDDGAALLDAVKKKGGLPTLELRASEAAAYRIQFDTLSH